MKKTQILLIHSLRAKLKAVRKVTQDNQSKKIAASDGIQSISPSGRVKLSMDILIDGKADSIKHVLIPKQGGKTRMLGIPTMRDRVKQVLIQAALEPQWEAVFDKDSYGSRPGRSVHDAIEAVFKSINRKPKYILYVAIEKSFDRIPHGYLIDKMRLSKELENQIRA